MTIKDMKIIESLKQIHPKDLIYSGILVLFMVTVGILFFVSTRFISLNINKVFSSEGAESVQVLDVERYQLIAKKLGIAVGTSLENTGVPAAVTPTPEISVPVTPEITTTTPKETEATATLDKKTLTIEVRNSTSKKGVAGTLAKSLEGAGFTTPTTTNEDTPYTVTTILIKESMHAYAPLILTEVAKVYPDAITASTTESAAFDVVIVIGGK